MKAIIDGKRYDTSTADYIHAWDNSYSKGDFKYRSKILYRTAKGVFFLLHFGGAQTDVAERIGNAYGPGIKIEPISEADAFGFLCSHDGVAKAEELFPERIEEA